MTAFFDEMNGKGAGAREPYLEVANWLQSLSPDAVKKAVLGENLKRLLTPILTAKGVRP